MVVEGVDGEVSQQVRISALGLDYDQPSLYVLVAGLSWPFWELLEEDMHLRERFEHLNST